MAQGQVSHTSSRARRMGWVALAGGISVGAALGLQFISSDSTDPRAEPMAGSTSSGAQIDVLHNPPLLFAPGEEVELRYRVVCPPPPDPTTDLCEPTGVVHLTSVDGQQMSLRLQPGGPTREDELYAAVPASVTAAGPFTYWAQLRDIGSGATAQLPAAGSDAPMTASPVIEPVVVELGKTDFSHQVDGQVVASGGWGSGPREFGRDEIGMGPTSFDVAPDGSIWILDHFNARLAVFESPTSRRNVKVNVAGDNPYIAIEPDGTIDVLYPSRPLYGSGTQVHRFHPVGGQPFQRIRIAGDGASRIQPLGDDVYAHGYDEQWMPVIVDDQGLTKAQQRQAAAPGQPVPGGRRVTVKLVDESEMRVSLLSGKATLGSWVVHSDTWLGAIHMAEPLGKDLIVVVTQWTNTDRQYRILRLTAQGVALNLDVPDGRYAEMAAYSVFRLAGHYVYQALPTPDAYSIVRYDVRASG